MWVHSESIVANAPPQAVWDLYARGAWQHWDDGIDSTRLDGPFLPGTVGYVKPRGGKEFRFRITQAQPPSHFTSRTRMTGAIHEVRHDLERVPGGCRVTHTALIWGPLAHFYGATLGRRLRREMPTVLRSLARLAEKEARLHSGPTPRAARPELPSNAPSFT